MMQRIVNTAVDLFRIALDHIRHHGVELIFVALFSLIMVGGHALSTDNTITSEQGGVEVLLSYTLAYVVLFFIFYLLMLRLREFLSNTNRRPKRYILKNCSDKKLWIVSSLLIFSLHLPVILLCISITTPDSWNSISQVTGDTPLNAAHPIIFTIFLGLFIKIGLSIGSLQVGLLLFSIAQSAIIAMIFAKVIVWMRSQGIGKWPIIATFIFYSILPINAVAGIIAWKDILFAGFGLILLIMLRELYINKGSFINKKNIALYIIFAFLFCVWRNNGIYVYLLFILLGSIVHSKILIKDLKLVTIILTPLVVALGYTAIVSMTLITNSSTAESLSVPLQQIARTVAYHDPTLSNNERQTIDEILPYSQLGKLYNPGLSDPVKSALDVDAFNNDRGKYLLMWASLFIKYPKTFTLAFSYNTYGYVYPYHESPTTTDILMDNGIHYNSPNDYIDTAQVNGYKPMMTKFRDIIMSAMPLLKNIGFYVCISIVCLYIAIFNRRKELIGVFIILLGLFITTVLGPVNGEFRYLYLFVIATPFLISSVFMENKKIGES